MSLGAVASRTAVIVVSVAALGAPAALWIHDRARHWEAPAWSEDAFVRVRAAPEAAGVRERRWVVVQPDCPHCPEHLARATAARARDVRIGALIVDQPVRPAADVFSGADVDEVRWDARGVWRRRWGHRVYGETLVFDGRRRYLRTEPPLRDPAPARAGEPGFGVPPDDR